MIDCARPYTKIKLENNRINTKFQKVGTINIHHTVNEKNEGASLNNVYSTHNWKYGTINIRTGKEADGGAKIYAVAKQVAQANLVLLSTRGAIS